MSELLTNTCILGFSDFLMASHAESTSDGTHRARAAIFGPFINLEISFTDSKSPGDDAGKPASIISTFNS